MEGLHNLRDRICSFENLMGAYRDAAQGKRYRGEVLNYTFDLARNLHELQDDLLNMRYKVGPYREFYVRFPKPRLVMALGFRDRIVQWAIYRQINPYLEKRYITHSYGCRKAKGTLAAAKTLHGWQQLISRKPDADEWYLIKGDISKYFYRVDHKKALDLYGKLSDDPWFHWAMDTIINNPDVPFGLPVGMKPDACPRDQRLYEVGMPIGNLTSQETANLYLNQLDQYCKHVLGVHIYLRYMDDFSIAVKGKENARRIFADIETFLRDRLALEMSQKSRIQKVTAPVEFVGYMITPHGMRLRKKTRAHVKQSMKHIMAAFASGRMSFEKAMESATCYLGICKHCNAHSLERWIEDNFVLRRDENMSMETMPPETGRHFYTIQEQEDGTVDVYLRPPQTDGVQPMTTEDGITDYDVKVLLVRGVTPYAGLEDDIRARYDAWCESADTVFL